MTLRSLIPPFLSEYVRLLLCRRRYPGCLINSPYIHPSVMLGRSCQVAQGCELWKGVTVGDYSYFSRGSLMASGSVGNYCSIAPYVQIGMPNHPTHFPSTSPFMYGSFGSSGRDASSDEMPSPPSIGHDVWIGSGAQILQGVTIGHGAVVAAGAVVTTNVAPFTIVAGIPARPIRRRFPDAVCDELLRLQWWNLPHEQLKAHPEWFAKALHLRSTMQRPSDSETPGERNQTASFSVEGHADTSRRRCRRTSS